MISKLDNCQWENMNWDSFSDFRKEPSSLMISEHKNWNFEKHIPYSPSPLSNEELNKRMPKKSNESFRETKQMDFGNFQNIGIGRPCEILEVSPTPWEDYWVRLNQYLAQTMETRQYLNIIRKWTLLRHGALTLGHAYGICEKDWPKIVVQLCCFILDS